MSVFPLFSLLQSQKFKDLPVMFREMFGSNEEMKDQITERYLDLDDKDRWSCLQRVMETCTEKGFYQERGFYHVLMRQEILGEEIDDDWEERITDECENYDNDKYEEQQKALKEVEKLKQQIEELKTNRPVAVEVETTRKVGRPTTRAVSTAYPCEVCGVHLASDGAMRNHFKSKKHKHVVAKKINWVKENLVEGYKMCVNTANQKHNPGLTMVNPDETHLDWILRHNEEDANAITWIAYCEPRVYVSEGTGRITQSWKSNIIPKTL